MMPRSSHVDATVVVPLVVQALSTVSRDAAEGDASFLTALEGLARAAVAAVPSAQMASLTAVDATGHLFTPVFTSDVARAMDRVQYQAGDGPTLTAAAAVGWGSVTVEDLREEPRWPDLAEKAHALGIRSVLSVGLSAEASLDPTAGAPSLGALNLYSGEPAAFGEQERTIALLLALYASIAVSSAAAIVAARREVDHLHRAMQSRNVIGQAQGILMERDRLSAGQAFDRLRTASQHLNSKLRDIAAQVAETGAVPVLNGQPAGTSPQTGALTDPARLAAVRRYDILDTPPDGAFDRVAALGARFLDVPIGMVNIVDADRVWVKAAHGMPGRPDLGVELGLCASVVSQDAPYLVTDTAADPRTREHPLVTGDEQVRFYAAVPIITADGHHLGTVAALDYQPHAEITDVQLGMLQDLAALVVDQLELRLAALQLVQHRRIANGHRQ